jgi:hypothetical protein
MTFGPGGVGGGQGRVFSVQQPEGFPVFIPEPAAAACVAAIGLLALRRRRR